MVGKFAHSFDRETFIGSEDTRQAALKVALDQAPKLESFPDTVYVGKRIPIDPASSGLADLIVAAMRKRVQATDDAGSKYLARVNEHQLAELDDEIDRVVRSWLTKHELMPTTSKVIAISEHPVPKPSMNGNSRNTGTEVVDLGAEDESNVTIR